MIFFNFLLLKQMHAFIAFDDFYSYIDTENTLHENHKGVDIVLHTNVKNIHLIQKENFKSINIYVAHFEDGTHTIIEKDIKLLECWTSFYFWIIDTPLVKQFCFSEYNFHSIICSEGALHIYSGDPYDLSEDDEDYEDFIDSKYNEYFNDSNVY